MIPSEVRELFDVWFDRSDGEPILRGVLGNRRIYAFKFNRTTCLGRPPRVIEENNEFRWATLDELNEIQRAIDAGMFDD